MLRGTISSRFPEIGLAMVSPREESRIWRAAYLGQNSELKQPKRRYYWSRDTALACIVHLACDNIEHPSIRSMTSTICCTRVAYSNTAKSCSIRGLSVDRLHKPPHRNHTARLKEERTVGKAAYAARIRNGTRHKVRAV